MARGKTGSKRTAAKKSPARKVKKAAPKKAASAKKKAAPAKKKVAPRKAPAPKAAPKKNAAPKKAAPKKAAAVLRRDRPGHVDPRYAAELFARSGHHRDENRDFFDGGKRKDDIAEELGEEAVEAMTSGEDGEALYRTSDAETGGPFVPSSSSRELADGVDESNPEDAEREPFPTT